MCMCALIFFTSMQLKHYGCDLFLKLKSDHNCSIIHNGLLLLFARDSLMELVNTTAIANLESYCAQVATTHFTSAVSALYVRQYSQTYLAELQTRVNIFFIAWIFSSAQIWKIQQSEHDKIHLLWSVIQIKNTQHAILFQNSVRRFYNERGLHYIFLHAYSFFFLFASCQMCASPDHCYMLRLQICLKS